MSEKQSPPTPEEIRAAVEQRTQDIPGAVEPEAPAQTSVFAGVDLSQFTAGSYMKRPRPELVWTFQGFLLTGNVCLLPGPPGVGKSFFSLQAGSAIAGGRGLEGILEPGVRGKVLVLAGEEDERIIPARVEALRNAFYPEEDDARRQFEENLLIMPLAGETVRLIEKVMGNGGAIEGTHIYRDLFALCCSIKNLRLVILDPLSRMFGLKEDDNSDATAFIILLEKLAKETGAAVVLLHHTSKVSTSRRQANGNKQAFKYALEQEAARGASGFVGAVRAQLNLVGLNQEEAKGIFGDADAQDNHYLAVGFPKCSYGPPKPIAYLQREAGAGGILRAVQSRDQEVAVKVRSGNEAILEWLVAKIDSQAANSLPGITKRTAEDYSTEMRETIPTATKAAVAASVRLALQDGRLVEVEGRNARGRGVFYLAAPKSTLLETDTVHTVHTVQSAPNSIGKAANS